jgi:CheY-like chemotaxis protein
MIVCLVDDLIFSIKISTAAKALGVQIYFERAADQVVQTIREKKPSLVILDLNSARLRPLEVIAALKADAELEHIETLGYVAHVQTDVIAAARKAGIDEVLARSAFSERLGDILRPTARRGGPSGPPA